MSDPLLPRKYHTIHLSCRFTLLTGVVICSFLFNHPLPHAIIFSVALFVIAINRRFPRDLLSLMPLVPVLLLIVICAGFVPLSLFEHPDHQTIIFHPAKRVQISYGGLLLGMTFGLRLINMVLFTRLLFHSVNPDDVSILMQKMKLPYTLSLSIGIAFRFIPELEKKRQMIITAQKLRGANLQKGCFFSVCFKQIKVMIPLIINGIIMAEKLTIALYSRGLGYRNQRTIFIDMPMTKQDLLVHIFIITCLTGLIAIRITYNIWVL